MSKAYPSHPRPSCHGLIVEENRVLLVERLRDPLAGHWGLPGGGIEVGETVAAALEREVREETGLQVAINRLLTYKDAIERDQAGQVKYHYILMLLEARVVGGTLKAGDDAGNVRWVPLEELPRYAVVDTVLEALAARESLSG